MAVVAKIDKMAVPVTTQAPPAVIVVSQNVICPIGTPPPPGATGTRGYTYVA